MLKNLQNPELPPSAIVDRREDRIWVRNDGLELRPAENNPFYVLATVHGWAAEADLEHHARNRRIWNGWACSSMEQQERAALAERMRLEVEELAPLSAAETDQLRQAFDARLGPGVEVPRAGSVHFENVYFSNRVNFRQCVFQYGSFANSYFVGANFKSAYFRSAAVFDNTYISGASFFSTFFGASAHFQSAHIVGASFDSAHINGSAYFHEARFVGRTSFGSACFESDAYFTDGSFESRASEGAYGFEKARFMKWTPWFHGRLFHDDPSFSLVSVGADGTRYWPPVAKHERVAITNRNAYRKLRQISASNQNAEAERFFLRQEMECSAKLEEDFLSRWLIYLYGRLSDYGYSVKGPFIGLISTWLIGALFIHFDFAWAFVDGTPPTGMEAVPGAGDAFGLGFANTVAIFGFRSYYLGEAYMISLPLFAKIIGAFQTIFGFIFLFFLGLGLRNRFRLK